MKEHWAGLYSSMSWEMLFSFLPPWTLSSRRDSLLIFPKRKGNPPDGVGMAFLGFPFPSAFGFWLSSPITLAFVAIEESSG